MEVLAKVLTEVLVKIVGGVELKARVEIRQPEELEVFNSLRLSVVLLMAVRY